MSLEEHKVEALESIAESLQKIVNCIDQDRIKTVEEKGW